MERPPMTTHLRPMIKIKVDHPLVSLPRQSCLQQDYVSLKSERPDLSDDVQHNQAGLVFSEPHFPARPPIDAYGDGGFRFADALHKGALLCVPSGTYGWNVTEETMLLEASLERVFGEADGIEVFLLGTGSVLKRIPDDLRQKFRDHGIMADPMATGPAVRTYNVLLSEGRAVAAGFLPVDQA